MTYTLPENITNLIDLTRSINIMIGNDIPAIMFMFLLFSISFIASYGRTSIEKSFLFASWITAISGIFITIIFQTDPKLVVVPIVLAAVSIILEMRRG